MDPERVIEAARGDVDEALLTRTDGGVLGRAVLADAPLVEHLDDGERLQYLLSGAAAPTKVVAGQRSPVETTGSYRTLLAVTDDRLLVVAGSRDGDRSLSFPYESLHAVERDSGLLTDEIRVRESPERAWEVAVRGGSDPAAAVEYVRGRIDGGAPPDAPPRTPDDPPRDAATTVDPDPGVDDQSARDPSTPGVGEASGSVDGDGPGDDAGTPGNDEDAPGDADDGTGWGLADSIAEQVDPDGSVDAGSDTDTRTTPEDGDEDYDFLSPEFDDVDLTDVDLTGAGTRDEGGERPDDPPREGTGDRSSAPGSNTSAGVDRIDTGAGGGAGTTDSAESERPGSGPGAGPEGWRDDRQADPAAEPSDGSRAPGAAEADLVAALSTVAEPPQPPDGESALVGALFAELVAGDRDGLRAPRGAARPPDDLEGAVDLLRTVYDGFQERLLADPAGAGAHAAAVDSLAAVVADRADEAGRTGLADRARSLRADARRALVAGTLDVDLQDDLTGEFGPTVKRLLRTLEPYAFEQVVADLWSALGYQTAVTQESADRGVDVVAQRSSPVEQTVLVQAKRYGPDTTVGSEEIQQYASLHRQERDADLVVVVTTGTFTKPATELASDLNVKLVDGDRLVELLDEAALHDTLARYVAEAVREM